ncbi:Hypothetical predicted protein [Mytilus galloprovincialis]|uniref:Uncharacterized protein n=1 Tax=Mytilus galloprovincialis TaxID=29158 RepID=A0A8B6FWU2_MYTGA|nr:Hypothetical predicted protein [Mytilus galloprovincialis]
MDKIAYLALRITELPIEKIIQQILESLPTFQKDDTLTSETVAKVIKSMDTEYDKQCAKALLVSNNCTDTDLYSFGVNPQTARNHINRIIDIVDECDNAELAANDIVRLHLEAKTGILEKRMAVVESAIAKMHVRTEYDQKRIEELVQNKEDLQIEIQEQSQSKKEKPSIIAKKLRQTIKRTAEDLIDKIGLKNEKLGAGPREKLEEDDEEFLLNCMETKATAPWRRHDSVLYLNHTVRKADFKNIVNHYRVSRGKQPIKSSTTVYNRSRPKSIRSSQAKRHRGKWLFSCKKPTKSEEKYRIHTKHQRAHVKRAVIHLCKSDNKLALIHSMDDKAYLKPEASDGLDKFRIFQTTDKSKQRLLPKYDFAQAKLNITPSSHRYFLKEIVGMDKNVQLAMTEDENILRFQAKVLPRKFRICLGIGRYETSL